MSSSEPSTARQSSPPGERPQTFTPFIVSNISQEANPLFEQRRSPLHGEGLFATQCIERGTLVFRERPLIQFAEPDPSPARIWSTYLSLPPHQGFMWYSLAHTSDPESEAQRAKDAKCTQSARHCGEILAKAENNSFHDVMSGRYVLALTAARINHSCKPNVVWVVNVETGEFEVRALSRIDAGEELVCSYVPQCFPRKERRYRLKNWRMKCTCQTCSDKNSEHEQLLVSLFEVYIKLVQLKRPVDVVLQTELYTKRLRLEREQDSMAWDALMTATVLEHLHRTQGEDDKAYEYSREAHELAVVCYGEGFKRSDEWKDHVARSGIFPKNDPADGSWSTVYVEPGYQ